MAGIDFRPGLPAERVELNHRYAPGNLTKVAAVYDRPFWRARGLTGSGLTTAGPASFTYDDTPPHGTPGIMVGFVGGDNARAYARMGAAARRHAVLEQFAQFFADPGGELREASRRGGPRHALGVQASRRSAGGGGPRPGRRGARPRTRGAR